MSLACALFGHRPRFETDGPKMSWACERCGEAGSKQYESAAQARRYAQAFDREFSDDLGRRAPLSLLPLRLARRGR